MGKITIQDLISNKNKIEDRAKGKTTFFVEELNGEMAFKHLSYKEYLDMVDEDYDDKDSLLIYEMCVEPNLKNDDLIKKLGCTSVPYEVVRKILSPTTINEIALKIMEISGLSKKEGIPAIKIIGEEIKN